MIVLKAQFHLTQFRNKQVTKPKYFTKNGLTGVRAVYGKMKEIDAVHIKHCDILTMANFCISTMWNSQF